MPDFGIMRGFGAKLFSDKLMAGQLPTQLGLIGSYNFNLLLDFYPNAAAAYSVRQLRNAYSGSAIRVRRSSDNAEQDIGFVSGNLDTSSLTSFCGAGNGFVTTWYDQSGNGRNATQSTAANQPQIVSSGSVITQGSKASVRFDGSNDYFGTSTNNPFTYTGAVSLIFVTYKTSMGSDRYESVLTAGATGNGALNQDKLMTFMYQNSGVVSPTPTISTDIWRPSGIQYNGTLTTNQRHLIGYYINNWSTHRSTGLSNLQYNGSDVSTKTFGSVNPSGLNTNPILIGAQDTNAGNTYFTGNMQEIIAYASDQNSNRTGINTNINSYYGIY